MSGKEVKIQINTAANTSGAKQAEQAIEQVGDSAREVATEAKQAEQALGKVESAAGKAGTQQGNLAKSTNTSAGSFKTMGPHVQNVSYQLQDFAVQVEGGTSMMRAFSQQAPQLFSAFGPGGAVFGMLIAFGPLLWKVFSKASEETLTADAAAKIYAETLTVLEEIAKRGAEERIQISKALQERDAERIQQLQKEQQMQESIASAESEREKKRIAAVGGGDVAQAKLELAQIEAKLVTATGAEAVDLQQQRERAVQRILGLEQGIRDAIRQQAMNAAQRKVDDAQGVATEAKSRHFNASQAVAEEEERIRQLNATIQKETEARQKTVDYYREQLAITDAQLRENPGDVEASVYAQKLQDMIAKAEQPSDAEAKASAELVEAKKSLAAALERSKAAEERATEANREVKTAEANRDQTQANQDQDRVIEDLGTAQQQQGQSEQKAAEGARVLLDQIMAALGSQAQSPEVQKQAQEVTTALADGLQANEADPVANALRALIGKIQADNSARVTLSQQLGLFMESAVQKISQLNGRIDELRNELNNVGGQMGNANH